MSKVWNALCPFVTLAALGAALLLVGAVSEYLLYWLSLQWPAVAFLLLAWWLAVIARDSWHSRPQ